MNKTENIGTEKNDIEENRYSNSKVYKLVSSCDDYFYIGSTTTSLSKRLYSHKQKSKRYPDRRVYKHFNAVGWEHVKIVLISEHLLNSREQLFREENEHIVVHKNNEFCLNSYHTVADEERYKKNCKENTKETTITEI